MAGHINFYSQEIPFTLKNKTFIRKWIEETATDEGKEIGEINYLFCDDNYILDVNRQFLQHDYLTDIITFDDCEHPVLSGDIVISIERVRDNAKEFKVPVQTELLRVLIHGILHLCGYKDKSKKEETVMRGKEDFYIQKYYNNHLKTN